MAIQGIEWLVGKPNVVGSFGSPEDLMAATVGDLRSACDLVEIRLDRMTPDGRTPDPAAWQHVAELPLLFTARRIEEGGAVELDAGRRSAMLEAVLDQAACIDVEVASINETHRLLERLAQRGIPWVASFHDFEKLPTDAELSEAARRAKDAGAAVFKAAAMLGDQEDLCRLADFQQADHGIPKATMGMGKLAAVSRLLCAQSGSVLNYGYLGQTPTAPGQWPCRLLKEAIERLPL